MVGILVGLVFLETALIFGLLINELAMQGGALLDLRFGSNAVEKELGWGKRNILSIFKLFLFLIVFLFSLYLGFTFYQTNATISSTLMNSTNNLSTNDRVIGEGLINLLSPAIGILFGISFAMAALIFATLAEIDVNEKMSEIKLKLSDIDEKLEKISNR